MRIRIRLRIRPEIEMKKKIFLYFSQVGIKFDIITHHFMLEFVDSDLYFVQDKNNFMNPLLQVGSGSGSVEKSTGSGSSSLFFCSFFAAICRCFPLTYSVVIWFSCHNLSQFTGTHIPLYFCRARQGETESLKAGTRIRIRIRSDPSIFDQPDPTCNNGFIKLFSS